MPTTSFKWGTPNAYATALSTGLNSLASGGTALSGAITTDSESYIEISVILASFTPAAPFNIEIHILPILDDATNYADLVAGNPATLVDSLLLKTGASAKYSFSRTSPQPPGNYKIGFINSAGAALAAASNTVKVRSVPYQAV